MWVVAAVALASLLTQASSGSRIHSMDEMAIPYITSAPYSNVITHVVARRTGIPDPKITLIARHTPKIRRE